ncbi:MAG: hypothetical protein GF332_03155 [Candidatus Moranbacteria bacterium]|nr:hypothetical protein [Candidatus Moranbacteria bacterium]
MKRNKKKQTKSKKLYVVSDLHIGGEGLLNTFEAKPEFLSFLKTLRQEARKYEIELVIAGDFIDFWDFQNIYGLKRLKHTTEKFKLLFEAIRQTGEKIKITLIPGNHDHDLACEKQYVEALKNFNVDLKQVEYLNRTINGKKIRIEHGNQMSSFNRFENFKSKEEKPYGYYIYRNIVKKIVDAAGQNKKKRRWLADLPRFHYPYTMTPRWFLSNYFYHELAMILKIIAAPFMLLFTASLLVFFLAIASRLRLINIPDVFYFTNFLGPVKYLANIIIIYNFISLFLVSLFWFLFKIVKRDVIKNLSDYGIQVNKQEIKRIKDHYLIKIRQFFKINPDYDIFIFGDTHKALLKKTKVGGKAKIIANSGAWNKFFHIVKSWSLLPSVCVPYYDLSYLVIDFNQNQARIRLKHIEKRASYRLTLLQRIAIAFRKRDVAKQEKTISI